MSWKVVQDVVVPKASGKSMRVNKGQIFRVIEHEGKQVMDLTFLNAHNHKEQFAAEFSAVLNSMQGMGGYYRLTKLYSKPPYENVLATVVDDKIGAGARGGERAGHYIMCHCSTLFCEMIGQPGTLSCSETLADAYSEIGLKQEDTFDQSIFNVWMQSWVAEDGTIGFARPLAETGDHMDFLAEMDIIAVFSICPAEDNECNDFKAKALRVQILEQVGGLSAEAAEMQEAR